MTVTVTRHSDPVYEQMFDDLIREVFGFSFEPWLARGLWDERYESHAIVQDGRMLSNVCIYKTDMRVHGQTFRAHQFGAVATRESERGKGFSCLLINHILALYPDIPAFLYANPDVIDFYPRFGFRQASMYRPGLAVRIDNPPDQGSAVIPAMAATAGLTAERYSADDAFIVRALNGKRVHSDFVDCLNTQSAQLFHLLLDYPDSIFFLPLCGAIVVAEQEGGKLFLADVITRKPVAFDELLKELPFSGVDCVEFGFCPDHLGVDPRWEPMDENREPFFLRGDWHLPERYRFPAMSAT